MMSWDEKVENNVVVVKLGGEIDLASSPVMRKHLQSKVQSKSSAVVFDFDGVDYIDSSGIATFVEYYKHSRSFQCKIAFAAMTPRVQSVFELVRLGEIFPFHASVEEAVQSVSL